LFQEPRGNITPGTTSNKVSSNTTQVPTKDAVAPTHLTTQSTISSKIVEEEARPASDNIDEATVGTTNAENDVTVLKDSTKLVD